MEHRPCQMRARMEEVLTAAIGKHISGTAPSSSPSSPFAEVFKESVAANEQIDLPDPHNHYRPGSCGLPQGIRRHGYIRRKPPTTHGIVALLLLLVRGIWRIQFKISFKLVFGDFRVRQRLLLPPRLPHHLKT